MQNPPEFSSPPAATQSAHLRRALIALAVLSGLALALWLGREYLRWSSDRAATETVSNAMRIAIEKFTTARVEFVKKQRRAPVDNLELGLASSRDPSWRGFDRVELFPNGDLRFEFRAGETDAVLVWRTRISNGPDSTQDICGAQGIPERALIWNGLACDDNVALPDPNARSGPEDLGLPAVLLTAADEVIAAVGRDSPERLTEIRNRGIDLCAATPEGETPMAAAVRGNQAKALVLLIAVPCDINQTEPISGRTPLMIASAGRNFEMTRDLLLAGATPTIVNERSESALFLSGADADVLSDQIRRMLVSKGADVNVPVPDGGSLLTRAAAYSNVPLTRWLLELGAKLDVQDNTGRSAVMIATLTRGGENVLPLLLAAGAQVNLRDSRGQTALAMCEKIKNPILRDQMVELLRTAGGSM